MSYWGNDYMPMVDELCIKAARDYINGTAFEEWWRCDGSWYTEEQAFRYLVCVLHEAAEDFAEGGGDGSLDGGYAGHMLEALAFGCATLMEGDWSVHDDCEWPHKLAA